jgi:hypothetical protein
MKKVERLRSLGEELVELTVEKNQAYGDSFANSGVILKALYPSGVRPDQYRDMLAVARVVDKLGRIANRPAAFGESPWKDIAGYALLGTLLHEEAGESEKETSVCRGCREATGVRGPNGVFVDLSPDEKEELR